MLNKGDFARRQRYSGPLYEQISRLLQERIQTKVWPVGNPIPNENELAREYGVSIGTMRRALEKLETAGLIARRQGRGTFVTDPAIAARRRLERFFLNGTQYVVENFTYDAFDVIEATARMAEVLEVPQGTSILRVRRHKVIKSLISIIEEIHIPGAFAGSLINDTRMGEQIGRDRIDACMANARRCREQVRPAFADEEVASVLEVPVGTPVLQCERLSADQGGRPVEWTTRVIVLDRVVYGVEVT